MKIDYCLLIIEYSKIETISQYSTVQYSGALTFEIQITSSMLKVGLTGGMGSGKTIVSKIFSVLGVPVFYADDAAKTVMNEDAELRDKIVLLFGDEAYAENQLNRKYISTIVFNDPFKLEQLNALVHPVTIAAADKWMHQQTAAYVIKEAALMFEAGAAAHLDYVIGVFAPLAMRIHRAMARDGITREEALARIDSQVDDSIKMKLCDFVIVNDEQQSVLSQALALHEKLLSLAHAQAHCENQ
jgi:dephospho-CoA kinase